MIKYYIYFKSLENKIIRRNSGIRVIRKSIIIGIIIIEDQNYIFRKK